MSQSSQLRLLPRAVWRRWKVDVGPTCWWPELVRTTLPILEQFQFSWIPDTNLYSSMIRLLRHIHISASEGNHTPSFLQSSVSPAQNLTIMINWKTSATWRLASKWSRCGQVWQPCRPGLVELSDASKIRVVWNWTELRPREWPAFFLRFQAERCRWHTVSFRNEVAGKTRMNH